MLDKLRILQNNAIMSYEHATSSYSTGMDRIPVISVKYLKNSLANSRQQEISNQFSLTNARVCS